MREFLQFLPDIPNARLGRRICLISACAVVLAAPASWAQIYKIVDKDGNVSFTDVPPKDDSATYEVKPGSSYVPPATDQSGDSEQRGASFEPDEDSEAAAATAYTAIDFTFPMEDQAVRENSGTLTFSLTISPPLQSGHYVSLSVDGTIVQQAPAASFTIEHMDRGTHVVQASIVDGQGTVLLHSPPRTFHLLRYSARH